MWVCQRREALWRRESKAVRGPTRDERVAIIVQFLLILGVVVHRVHRHGQLQVNLKSSPSLVSMPCGEDDMPRGRRCRIRLITF